MSPVFRHGRLRLYLLKLLDEAPRHGYEVIRLLQDRFMGVYAPSPGTIYPRLARLEEEGLVTHDEVDGKKVYRITDKGREEIQNRLEDLADLEEEITESVRDIAREVTEDVRDTVRNLREELTWASREVRDGKERARDTAREKAKRAREEVRDSARQARDELHGAARGGETGSMAGGGGKTAAVRRAAEVGQATARQATDRAARRPAVRRPAAARDGPPAAGLRNESAAARTGATGPAGRNGPAGPAGPAGLAGAAGLTSRDRRAALDGRLPAAGRKRAWQGTWSGWRLASPGTCCQPPGALKPSARMRSPTCAPSWRTP